MSINTKLDVLLYGVSGLVAFIILLLMDNWTAAVGVFLGSIATLAWKIRRRAGGRPSRSL